MKYDDNGNLVLSGKLGEAVISGEGVEEYAKALMSGKSERLSYQDMQDFQDFTSEFFVLGKFPSRKDGLEEYEAFVLLRKSDQAPFGIRYDAHFGISYPGVYTYVPETEGTPDHEVVIFQPMQPFTFQGYEPVE